MNGFNNYLGGRGVAMSKFTEDDEKCFESDYINVFYADYALLIAQYLFQQMT